MFFLDPYNTDAILYNAKVEKDVGTSGVAVTLSTVLLTGFGCAISCTGVSNINLHDGAM